MGCVGCYSLALTRWPLCILSTVFSVVVVCGILAIFVIPAPEFNNPILGFEARGTKIKGQEQVMLMLQEPMDYNLSFTPVSPFGNETLASPYVIWTFNNYIKSTFNLSSTVSMSKDLNPNRSPQKMEPSTITLDCGSTSFEPTLPKVVFAREDGGTLLTETSIRAMCVLEKRITKNMEPEDCLHRLSITYYMEKLFGKSCENVDESDIASFIEILHLCISFYETGIIHEFCDNKTCIDLPFECRQDRAVYNILHYLSDNEFFHRDINQVKHKEKLSYALMSVANLNVEFTRFYREHIEGTLLHEGGVYVKAVDSRVKFELFNVYLLENMIFFVVAMALILFSMMFYLRSCIITIATLLNVIFTIVIAYCIYYLVLGIHHFPFINLLTGLICIAISADDVFIFYDTWQQMKRDLPEETRTVWLSKTFNHATLSIFVTSLTTASAFFANVVSEITDIKCFGIFSGVAIMCNFALMITWVPSVVCLQEEWGKNCCTNSSCNTNCSYFEKLTECLGKVSIIFEKILPLIIIKTWFIWLILLFLLGVGGAVVLFVEPRLELPDSREFQVFKRSDPMEIWDLDVKHKFRYTEFDANDITSQGLPISIVWGMKSDDNGNSFDPGDRGTLKLDSTFNMSSRDAQVWMEKNCNDFKRASFVADSIKTIPCTISIFNDMMKLPCEHEGLKPCCGQSSQPPYSADLFELCFPKIVSAVQFILQQAYGLKLGHIVMLGTPVYYTSHEKNTIAGYTMTAIAKQAWSPILEKMDGFLGELESFVDNSTSSAPPDVRNCWITSGFKFYDLQRALSSGTYIAIGVSVAVAFVVMLVTTLNVFITIYALFTIMLTISVTVGSLVLLGWKLNILESITISLAVGLSIDFSIHYGVAFRLSKSENKEGKVQESFARVGTSVAMAAFTTFLAGAAIMPAQVLVYKQLGVFLMLVMTISWTYASFFFQSLCRIIGPTKTVNSPRCLKRKVSEEVTPTANGKGWDPDMNFHEMQSCAETGVGTKDLSQSYGIETVPVTNCKNPNDGIDTYGMKDRTPNGHI